MTMQPLNVIIPVSLDWFEHHWATSAAEIRHKADIVAAKRASRYELQTEELVPPGATLTDSNGKTIDLAGRNMRLIKFTYLAEPKDAP